MNCYGQLLDSMLVPPEEQRAALMDTAGKPIAQYGRAAVIQRVGEARNFSRV